MIYIFVFLMLLMKESKGEWNLFWNEEFENQTLDEEKWEIENELTTCYGNYIEQLNCNTNSGRNLRLINGTLAITAIYEKYLDKDYTSGKITTKQGFTYGKFEIRAALPKGKLLRSAIFMIPVTTSSWARNGQIDIMTDIQAMQLISGLHFNLPATSETHNMAQFKSNTNLNDFHTYAIEWNQFEFKWFFDDINYLAKNINRSLGSIYTKNGEPFDMPFRLLINLGVGGLDFLKQIITVEDVMDWKCSLLIIDYVRIYKWIDGTEKHDSKGDRVSTANICSDVMPLITPKIKENQYSLSITVIAIIISVTLLFIVLIGIIVFSYIRKKKVNKMNTENNSEKVGDSIDVNLYEDLNTSSQNEDCYEEISDDYFECNPTNLKENVNSKPIYLEVIDSECDGTKRLSNNINQKENMNPKPIYLEINNEFQNFAEEFFV